MALLSVLKVATISPAELANRSPALNTIIKALHAIAFITSHGPYT